MSTTDTNTNEITLEQYLTECELYPYSTEHFDLMRECSELNLIEMCLDSADYLTEHADLDSSVKGTLIVESAEMSGDEQASSKLTNAKIGKRKAIWSKLTGAFTKMMGVLSKIWASFVKFLQGKHSKRIEQLDADFTELNTKLSNTWDKGPFVTGLNKLIDDFFAAEENIGTLTTFGAARAANSNKAIHTFLKGLKGLEGIDSKKLNKAIGYILNTTSTQIEVMMPEIGDPAVTEELLAKLEEAVNTLATSKNTADAEATKNMLVDIQQKINSGKPRLRKSVISYEDLKDRQAKLTEKTKSIADTLARINTKIQETKDGDTDNNGMNSTETTMGQMLTAWNDITAKSIRVMNEVVRKCDASLNLLTGIKNLAASSVTAD